MKLNPSEKTLSIASAKSGMSENTARKYINLGRLPSQCKKERIWRTRDDPFEGVWDAIEEKLESCPGFEAKTLFQWLQRKHPGKFEDGQLRTLQRKIKQWRALEGPARETYFDQKHYPGRLCESDFTHMTPLGVTISGEPFHHLIYHFVLTWSNWETGTICFSESFESLCNGLQNALWELGGVPVAHRTDRLSAAVQKIGKTNKDNDAEFTKRYQALFRHYGLEAQKIQAGKANENGDVEQRHYRFKRALEQSLLLRGNRDFESRAEYGDFLRKLFRRLNAGRRSRFSEELETLKSLPAKRLDDHTSFTVRVGPGSTVRIQKKVYSVHSRLIGEHVKVRLYADYLEAWYAQKRIETVPRIRGSKKHHIQYRHIIDWLIRKPGAFENYRYRQDLFPSSRFKMAYDFLKDQNPSRANKVYLRILKLAAGETEIGKTHLVCAVARKLVQQGRRVYFTKCGLLVQQLLIAKRDLKLARALKKLGRFDALVIDDIGYVQQDRREMEVLFTLLAERYERGSVMITSNLPFSKWEKIFKDPMTTAAAIDRVVDHSVILELNIPSYRMEEAQSRTRK